MANTKAKKKIKLGNVAKKIKRTEVAKLLKATLARINAEVPDFTSVTSLDFVKAHMTDLPYGKVREFYEFYFSSPIKKTDTKEYLIKEMLTLDPDEESDGTLNDLIMEFHGEHTRFNNEIATAITKAKLRAADRDRAKELDTFKEELADTFRAITPVEAQRAVEKLLTGMFSRILAIESRLSHIETEGV